MGTSSERTHLAAIPRGARHIQTPPLEAAARRFAAAPPRAARSHSAPAGTWSFGDVRVHADGEAAAAAEALRARAFTVGRDIYFAAGEYSPRTAAGEMLLRHELSHVAQQAAMHAGGPVLQCDPAPPKGASLKPDLEKKHGDTLVAQYTVKGIRFGVTIGVTDRTRIEKSIVAIADAIVEANALITDPKFRVKTCAIANATTRFATLGGASVLVLDTHDADAPSARHELGHATFHFLRTITGDAKQPLRDVALQLTDIFRELAATKPVKSKTIASDGTTEEKERPAGLWIADPPQWSGSRKLPSEHPWEDADELFASSREAFLVDAAGFNASIARFVKLDPAVKAPAARLVALLGALKSGKTPSARPKPSEKASDDLAAIGKAGQIETTLESPLNDTLRWALDPSTTPWESK